MPPSPRSSRPRRPAAPRKRRSSPRRPPSAPPTRTSEDDGDKKPAPRQRARRPSRRKRTGPLEGTFDHGEEGYGLWLDPAVEDDPIYAEHWAGHRPVEVTIEEDQIVIKRAGGGDEDDEG